MCIRDRVERPFPSRSFVIEALETLRLLCEGHNNAMQEHLREQPNDLSDIDMVSEVYQLLYALEPEIDETNIEQVRASTSRPSLPTESSAAHRECSCTHAHTHTLTHTCGPAARQVIKCIETLTEFIQGNISRGNTMQASSPSRWPSAHQLPRLSP